MTLSPAALLVASLPSALGRTPIAGEILTVGWTDSLPNAAAVLIVISPDAYPYEQTQACHQLVTDGATTAVFVAYTGGRTPELDATLHWLVASAVRYGLDVPDALIVSGGRLWSLGCTDPSCCPPEGTPLTEGPTP